MANENREPYVLDFPNGQRVEDILKKADADYSKAEIDAKMASKATMSDVQRETQNLQNQINEIVRAPESGGDVAAEVAQARVGTDGTTYPTLKMRLDSEYDNLTSRADLNETMTELAYMNGTIRTQAQLDFRFGHIGPNGGIESSTKQVCNNARVRVTPGSTISVDSGYKYQYALYDADTASFIRRQTWLYDNQSTIIDGTYRIVVEIADINESVLSDLTIVEHLHANIYDTALPVSDAIGDSVEQPLRFTNGKNITIYYPLGTVIDITDVSTVAGYSYAIMDVSPGQVFSITGNGGRNPRLWGVLNSDSELIAVAGSETVDHLVTNLKLTMPPEAATLIVNAKIYDRGECKRLDVNATVDTLFTGLQEEIETSMAGLRDTPLTFINGQNLKLAYPIGTVIDITATETVAIYSYAIEDVVPGDIISITGSGGFNPRLYGIIDSENRLIEVYKASEELVTDFRVSIPENGAKIIVNAKILSRGDCYKCGIAKQSTATAETVVEIDRTLADVVDDVNYLSDTELNALRQSNNIVYTLGLSEFRQHTMEVAKPEKYKCWPFVGVAKGRLVCLYTIGNSHTDTHSSVYKKLSDNGVIWSADKFLLGTSTTRDNITGKGYDSNSALLFWVRHGYPGAATTTFELIRTTDGITFETVSTPTFDTVPGHIGDIVMVPDYGLFAFFNTYGDARSWGYIRSQDNGETWTQTVLESNQTIADCPVELSPVYLGNGKILVIGRRDSNAAAGLFQIQSSDFGGNFTKLSTNITDTSQSTPSVLYDSATDMLSLYYFHRSVGQLRLRQSLSATIWDNPTTWADPQIVSQVSGRGEDTGNVNACQFGDLQVAAFYSGNSANTGVYVTLI